MSDITLTEKEYVQIGLWEDDPYGEGLRKAIIRDPPKERKAALDFVNLGQVDSSKTYKIYLEKGKELFNSSKFIRRVIYGRGVIARPLEIIA